MNQTKQYLMVIFALLSGFCISSCSKAPEQAADVIYSGGDIITMVDSSPGAEAIAVKGDRILAVGTKAEVMEYKGSATRMADLGGKTLLPGFIDAHGHFSLVGFLAQSANLLPPPDGDSTDFAGIAQKLKAHMDSPQAQEMGWVIGMDYDDSQLAEKRHPTAQDLDKMIADRPVMIVHQSAHLGVVNTIGLELIGYDASTPNPPGGQIRRIEGSNQPNGVLEENAFFAVALKLITPKTPESLFTMIGKGQQAYVAAGFTTAQEGRATPGNIEGLAAASAKHLLQIDVAAYPDPTFYGDDQAFNSMMATQPGSYTNHYRIGGIKLSLDGSPQGKTAWLTHPYHIPPHGKDTDYAGYPAMQAEDVDKYVDMAFTNHWQILVHSNGDAASDQFISSVGKAVKTHGETDLRPVIIHAQILREDQLDAMKALKVIPSFMTVHTFYWGDWHLDSVLGEERAMRISPTRSALDRGMVYTAHNDAPVTLPNAMMVLSSQVNRVTRSGKILGKDQQVSVMEALKSITINAAYQYSEEANKGSLEVNKLADFVILDKNPLIIDPMKLNDIKIVETIKGGKIVFSGQ